jgi:hypothetical protein
VIRYLALALLWLGSAAASAEPLTDRDRAQVIRNAAELLETRYVDPQAGARLARSLRTNARLWSSSSDPAGFAAEVTAWLRRESGDGHLGLSYSAQPIAEGGAVAAFTAATSPRTIAVT